MTRNEQLLFHLPMRLRRNRKSASIRRLVRETELLPSDLIAPLFVIEGRGRREAIPSMPGVERLSIDYALQEAAELHAQGIEAVALFPVVKRELRSPGAEEAWNEEGLLARAIRAFKERIPTLSVIADVALDPFTSHGHDGLTGEGGEILNDPTVECLVQMALMQARCGVDLVAPSDMMDGRVGAIRKALDEAGYADVSILAYSAKYASSLYGPFREAVETRLAFGDKKSYQMDPANVREACLEALLDQEEGADILMVKPATLYLDVIAALRARTDRPIAAYHVSGEYAMVMAAAERGWLDAAALFHETLLSIKRAGADMIFTYAAKEVVGRLLRR
ncbi:MAG: porphobilinogen synthase [Verrucomicrobiota bacterium]|nr:porphobilinogen synthase [Verrucomicrobiota bacterium]